MPRPAARLLALSVLVALAGCGGDSTTPPAGLAYATNPATYTRGTAIAANAPTSTGGAVDGYAVTPALPAGLSLHPTTGVLSGTPTAITPLATYTVTATNAGGSTTATLGITVNDAAPSGLVYSNAIAAYTIGVAIPPNTPTSTGGAVVGYTVSPALPAGLSLDPATGIVTGTPTAITPSALHVVTATNSGGSTEGALILRVNDVPPSELTYATNPIVYTRGVTRLPNLPTHFGGVATSWTVTPALPAGLSLNAATGIVSGTPTAVAAQATYTVTATNSGGSTSAPLVVTVVEPTLVSVAVTPSSADVTAGGSSLPLTARATYSDASITDVTSLATWTTTAAGQVDVTTGGLASAPLAARVGNGGTVTATFGGQQGSTTLRVVRGPPVGPLLGNDPLAAQQWYLVNTGQMAYSDYGGIAGEDLRLTTAMGLGLRGAGVKVAVVDTGLEIAHVDLADNVVPGSWNFVDDTDDPTRPTSYTGGDHGTSVAGIIGMVYDNDTGGMGVASLVGLNGYNFLAEPVARHDEQVDRWLQLEPDLGRRLDLQPELRDERHGAGPRRPGDRGAVPGRRDDAPVGQGRALREVGRQRVPGLGTASCGAAQAIGVSCENASMDGKNALPYNIVVGALDARGVRSSYSSAGSAIWVSAPGGKYGRNESVSPGRAADFYEPAMVTTDRTGCDLGYAVTGATTSAFNQGRVPQRGMQLHEQLQRDIVGRPGHGGGHRAAPRRPPRSHLARREAHPGHHRPPGRPGHRPGAGAALERRLRGRASLDPERRRQVVPQLVRVRRGGRGRGGGPRPDLHGRIAGRARHHRLARERRRARPPHPRRQHHRGLEHAHRGRRPHRGVDPDRGDGDAPAAR